ncbi:MAG: hypothetical protein V2A76_12925 [Planctomycetota bacterium]
MRVLSSIALASLALLSLANTASGAGIVFSESYEKAFQEATERGVPLMIAVIQDDEEANDDVWPNTINAPEFVRATLGTVNLLGNRGTQEMHGYKEVEVAGKPRRLCAKFGGMSCMDHSKAEIQIFRDFARDGQIGTPQVMLVLPDQTIVAALVDRHPMPDFLEAFAKAKKMLPGGLTYEEAINVREGLKDSKVWLEQGKIDEVIKFALPLTERSGSGATLIQQAEALMKEVEQLGRKELELVETRLKEKEYAPAMELLDDLIRRYKKSMIEAVAKERRAHLSKNREIKAAIAQAKKEDGARKILESADELKEKGEDSRAEKLYQRLRERFADTKAGQELAERESGSSP